MRRLRSPPPTWSSWPPHLAIPRATASESSSDSRWMSRCIRFGPGPLAESPDIPVRFQIAEVLEAKELLFGSGKLFR